MTITYYCSRCRQPLDPAGDVHPTAPAGTTLACITCGNETFTAKLTDNAPEIITDAILCVFDGQRASARVLSEANRLMQTQNIPADEALDIIIRDFTYQLPDGTTLSRNDFEETETDHFWQVNTMPAAGERKGKNGRA